MNDVAALEVTLRFADGSKQTLTVDSESARIGSGAHCEVRLSADDAGAEQLEIRVTPVGLMGSARDLERPMWLDGAPFIEGRLEPESELKIGSVTLSLRVTTSHLVAAVNQKHVDPGSRLIRLLAVVGFPLGFYLLSRVPHGGTELPPEVEPPPLWSHAAAACPEGESEASLALGRAELARAATLGERAPFSGRSGVGAVSAFERAAACLRAGGEPSAGSEAERRASNLRVKVEREFHVHRVRLERALALKRYEDAHVEVSLLLAFIGKTGDEYRSWLLALDRQIELKFMGKRT